MVVRVWPDEFPNNQEEKTGLNLQVFLDGTNDNEAYRGIVLPAPIDTLHGTMWYTSAQYASPGGEKLDETPDHPAGVSIAPANTWHWPETV